MHCSMIMAPNHHFMLSPLPLEPVSRSYQYRKIMKPMLERKRRARINKCLDELKDLMTGTFQADGENVSKLEKADILELTVRHLQRLREHNTLFLRTNDTLNMEKFWAGFQHCAVEVSQFLSKYDENIIGDVVKHMASYIPNVPPNATAFIVAPPNTSNNATLTCDRKLSTDEIHPQKMRSRHAHSSDAKVIQKSKISTDRRSFHPYAADAALVETSSSNNINRENDVLCVGGDGISVWRPW